MDAKIVVALVGIGIGVLMKVADGSLKDKGLWGTLGTVFILAGVVILAVLIIGEFGIQFRSPVFVTSSAGSPVTFGWWVWLVAAMLLTTLALRFSAIKKWWASRLPASSVATILPPSIETSREEGNVSLALSQIVADSTTIDTEKAPFGTTAVVIFVVEHSYVDYTEGKEFPLKLVVHWANEGEEIHIGKPRWIERQVTYQGQRIGQGIAHRFKVNPEHGKNHTECDEVTAKSGYKGQLWIGLDSSVGFNQADLWKRSSNLGTLILPVTIRGTMKEIRIRL